MTLPFPAAAILLAGVGFVAGVVNVLAGGGSLLSLPVLVFLGLPATVANGTNRVAILVQNIGASWSFRRHGLLTADWLKLGVPPAVVGALVGTWAAVQVDEVTLQRVLAGIMVLVAIWTLWNPVKPPLHGRAETPRSLGARLLFGVGFFVVGLYGGFIQAGVGFLILALMSAGGLDLVRSNALKVTLVLVFTPLALAGFAWNGMVNWGLGASLAAGNLLGGLVGVRLNVKKGQEWVRRVVVFMVLVFAARLWLTA